MKNKSVPTPPDIASDLVRNGLPSDAFDPTITVKYNGVNYALDARDLAIFDNLRYPEPTSRFYSIERPEPANLAADPLYVKAKNLDATDDDGAFVVLIIQHRIATVIFKEYIKKQFEYVKAYNKLVDSACYYYSNDNGTDYGRYLATVYSVTQYGSNENRIKLK